MLITSLLHVAMSFGGPESIPVTAVRETEPVVSSGDAADDIAIWVHPADPLESFILGTDKKLRLEQYDLNGKLVRVIANGRFNNVDIRQRSDGSGFFVASNRTDDTLMISKIDTAGGITRWQTIDTGLDGVYGVAAAITQGDDRNELFHAFVNTKPGQFQHWVWSDSESPKLVRAFSVGGETEGMVADEHHGVLYIGEEQGGIWRYPLDPTSDDNRSLIDAVKPVGRHLTKDVEGLTIADHGDGTGYLIASSQGSDRFVVYDRVTNEHVFTFHIAPSADIDGVSETDGIDVNTSAFSDDFPLGFFVAQDNENDTGFQNFKMICWAGILSSVQSGPRVEVGE